MRFKMGMLLSLLTHFVTDTCHLTTYKRRSINFTMWFYYQKHFKTRAKIVQQSRRGLENERVVTHTLLISIFEEKKPSSLFCLHPFENMEFSFVLKMATWQNAVGHRRHTVRWKLRSLGDLSGKNYVQTKYSSDTVIIVKTRRLSLLETPRNRLQAS